MRTSAPAPLAIPAIRGDALSGWAGVSPAAPAHEFVEAFPRVIKLQFDSCTKNDAKVLVVAVLDAFGDDKTLAGAGDGKALLVNVSCDLESEAEAVGKASAAGDDACDMLADGIGENKTLFVVVPLALRIGLGVRLPALLNILGVALAVTLQIWLRVDVSE